MLGLLLIDHGSRRELANRQLDDMAAQVRLLRPHDLVAVSHLEICSPLVPEAIQDLVSKQIRIIHALPYFLSDGRHSQLDLPRLCQQARDLHRDLTIHLHPVLGPHRLLAQLLLERSGLPAEES
jgi:sirohydrochlorin ferrochelatase